MLGMAGTITIAWSVSSFISSMFIEHSSMSKAAPVLLWLIVGGVAKSTAIWLGELLAVNSTATVKFQLRQKFFSSINRLGSGWLAKRSIAELNMLATTGLDALDPYFAKYLPQLVSTALVTPILLFIIWLKDFSSGLVLLFTLPLVPLFMILIGWATRAVQERQLESLNALSRHFLEVLRGLTTLKIFNRVSVQREILKEVSNEHRLRTMKVLRITFLSGFALELISSLSVAIIAVSIGLRLLSGDLNLSVGLFVLLLAPETFLPLRQVGAQFHASSEGVAASEEILSIIESAGKAQDQGVATDNFKFDPATFYAITGPSGAGKSTLVVNLLGLGESSGVLAIEDCAWMPQRNKLFAGTVAENIVGIGNEAILESLEHAMRLAALDDLSPSQQVGENGSAVSGGQSQRICLARAFYRATTSKSKYLVLDEPISALDEARASAVIAALSDFASQGKTVIAVSHQSSLINAANQVIEVKHARYA